MGFENIFINETFYKAHGKLINELSTCFNGVLQCATENFISFRLNSLPCFYLVPHYLDFTFSSQEYSFHYYNTKSESWSLFRVSDSYLRLMKYQDYCLEYIFPQYRALIWRGFHLMNLSEYAEIIAEWFDFSAHDKMEALLHV